MEEQPILLRAPWALVPLEPGRGGYIFLKVFLYVLLVQTFGVFFSAVSVGLSLSQNDHLFFIAINHYIKNAINYSHMF